MKKIRIGVYGLWRGSSFLPIIGGFEDAEVAALCEKDEGKLKAALERAPGAKACADFDELLESGIDAVFLCNYFHEHAKCAIKAMEHGIAVFSECTSAPTLAECVKLVETAERTGTKYMIAENYPFTAAMLEMKRIAEEGTLGRILYAEGEYNHTCPKEELAALTPGKYHWRGWMPRTYYVTHTLGPLMHITGQMPVKVNAFAVHSDVLEQYDDFRHNYDAFAMMNCITDGGALFRFTGCAAMGSPSGYRVVGENGSCESGRTLGSNVNVTYHHWLVPEGRPASDTYAPSWSANAELAEKAGHGGGDFWTVYNFMEYLKNGKEPFFNVYRGACMSAVGILGWRSCMEDGKTYKIPDFRKKEDRDAVRDDDLSPFPDENGHVTLPCAIGKRMNGK
jgi:predicted dehydrogenase